MIATMLPISRSRFFYETDIKDNLKDNIINFKL